jgi:hypothetical protein
MLLTVKEIMLNKKLNKELKIEAPIREIMPKEEIANNEPHKRTE